VEALWTYVSDRLEKNFRRTVFAAPGQATGFGMRPAGGGLRPAGGTMKGFKMRAAGSFASLSSGLLARKGHASPAMRRQAMTSFRPATSSAGTTWVNR
jgi:hypothetical protein